VSVWQAGVVGGIAGAAVMAVLISGMNAAVLRGAIPALYGLSGGVAGWVVHLSHGAVLGVGFPGAPPFPNFAPPSLLWHAVYGGVLGVAHAGLR